MTLRDQIIQQALTLHPDDREYMADLLEGSLPVAEFWTVGITDVWTREIDRRIADFDRGETTAVDFEVALDNMRQALESHRANKAVQ
jgi:hypothetical protein